VQRQATVHLSSDCGHESVAPGGDEESPALANAGVVRSVRIGRESLFELEPWSIEEVRNYLDQISKQWDDASAGLKSHVED
jgi:hypothetical protein